MEALLTALGQTLSAWQVDDVTIGADGVRLSLAPPAEPVSVARALIQLDGRPRTTVRRQAGGGVLVHVRQHTATPKTVAVRVPERLVDTVAHERATTGASNADQVLNAYNRHSHVLREAGERREAIGLPPGGPRRRPTTEPMRKLWLHLEVDQLQALTQAAARWSSGNLSALVTTVLLAEHSPTERQP